MMNVTAWTLAAGIVLGAVAPAAGEAGVGKSSRVTPVVEAYRKASPAVVNISTERLVRMGFSLFGDRDDPFERFMPRLFGRSVPAVSLGSGFLVHPDGYLITNAHVVRRAEKITVTLSDKSTCEAQVVAANTGDDMAVLKIEPRNGRPFPYLPLGRSDDLMIGETVIAIGNPMGYQNTCTTGVISALNRKLEFRGGNEISGLIQTDAPINPGNSGGPLLNRDGRLIGVNTAIRADAQGIGFAIPVDRVSADLPKLLDFERLNRVVFGLTVEQRHQETTDELVVTAVAPGTPAQAGGCKVGDRLLALNGRNLMQLPDYQFAMLKAAPGDAIRLTCWRSGKTLPLTVTVKARPKPDGAALAGRLMGLEVRTITRNLARDLRLAASAGLLVTGVEREGPADKLGIRRGDIVFQLGRWYVTDLDRLGAILEDVQAGDTLRIGIIRGNVRAWGGIRVRKGPPVPASELVKDKVSV